MLVFNNYTYIISASAKGRSVKYYKCAHRKKFFCKASLKEENGNFEELRPHSHPADAVQPDLLKQFKEALKYRVIHDIHLNSTDIYEEEMLRHPEAAIIYPWPKAKEYMRSIKRRNVPLIPSSLEELSNHLLMQAFGHKYTCHGQTICKNVLRHGPGNGVSVVFFCNQLIAQMIEEENSDVAENAELHADATFKAVPATPQSRQLFTIHLMFHEYSVPVFFALMEKKTQAAYKDLITFFKENVAPTLVPKIIITDFEVALQNAFEEVYGISTTGCFFHYCQALWHKMVKENYLRVIRSNENANTTLRMLMALPLLPCEKICQGLEVVENYARTKDIDLSRIFAYMRRFWIRRIGPQRMTVANLPRRTNNNIESFHNKLNNKFKEVHPNFWKFLEFLCELISGTHVKVNQINSGLRITDWKKVKYITKDRALRNAEETLGHRIDDASIRQFLKTCAYILKSSSERMVNWAVYVEGEEQPTESSNEENEEYSEEFDEESPTYSPLQSPDVLPNLPFFSPHASFSLSYSPNSYNHPLSASNSSSESNFSTLQLSPNLSPAPSSRRYNISSSSSSSSSSSPPPPPSSSFLLPVPSSSGIESQPSTSSPYTSSVNPVSCETDDEEEATSDDFKVLCSACWTRPPTYIFLDCFHVVVCDVCIDHYKVVDVLGEESSSSRCPVCRTLICTEPKKVYFYKK